MTVFYTCNECNEMFHQKQKPRVQRECKFFCSVDCAHKYLTREKRITIVNPPEWLSTINDALQYLHAPNGAVRAGSLVGQDLRNMLELLKDKLEGKEPS